MSRVRFWGVEMDMGGRRLSAELRESNDALDDAQELKGRLDEDGYLFVRNLRPREVILEARRAILERLRTAGVLDPESPLMDGIVSSAGQIEATTSVRGNDELRRLPAVQALFRMPQVRHVFEGLLGGPVGTFDFQWLRVAGPGSESPIHSDIVFMGRGTKNLYTCWTPLGDVSLDMGPIVLCVGTHKAQQLRDTYWAADVDRDLIEGWFSKDPMEVAERFGGRWATSEFRAGDVLIFGMYILHGSLANTSNRFRLSVDARYQLASEPFDERWVGDPVMGHYNAWKPGIALEPPSVSRARWGLGTVKK